MFTMLNQNTRRMVSAVSAVAVVAFSGLVLDQGHLGTMPDGVVEVGEMQPYNLMQLVSTTFPEIVVTAQAFGPEPALAFGEPVVLPEVVVIGERQVQVAESGQAAASDTQG
jgi:hypothetical protein